MTIEEIRRRKKELRLTTKQLSERSGVSVSTLQKILGNTTANPRYETLYALENALQLGTPETYTVEDYLALPENSRTELIDGVFYNMGAPSTIHQQISVHLSAILRDFILSNGGSCVPFSAPCSVQLDKDDKTMLEPDIFVVCDRDKILDDRVFGAPDLVIEILSPSSRPHDMRLKKAKYMNAGVREYWMIDPGKKKIIVDLYDDDLFDTFIFGFEEKVPVAIFGGNLTVNFAEIYENIRFLYHG